MTARPIVLSPTDRRTAKLAAWRRYINFPGDHDTAWLRYQAELETIEALEETAHARLHLAAMTPERRAQLEREWGA